MKTKIDILFEDLWVNEYKKMKEQIFKIPKGPHGFGDIGEYKDGILWLKEEEFERLKEKAKSHEITIKLAFETGLKDYLKIGAENVKVAGKPVKVGNQYPISNVDDCCLYALSKEQFLVISAIYDYYLKEMTWPTARNILIKRGRMKIREIVEEFPKNELIIFNDHTATYRLTIYGFLHCGRDESIFKAIDYVIEQLKADMVNSRDKSKILYTDIHETAGMGGQFAKEIVESLLGKLGSRGSMTDQYYEVDLPNDERRCSLILDYANPISLCYSLFAKSRFYEYELGSSILDLYEPLPDRKGVIKMEQELMGAKKVFIVHGHDEGSRESTARFVEKLGLSPIILHEQPNIGRTIIEKFEDYADVGFAIVLLTPDDVGGPSKEPEKLKPRARQNVIFELGYFIGKLGRGRVVALYIEGVEIPSDYKGVIYIPIDKSGGWKHKLAKELRTVWADIDLNKAI